MRVLLISHTPDTQKVVASAAKLCYSSSDIASLMQGLEDEDKVNEFIERLSSMGHGSPFEHISYTFGIDGVSRSLSHQLVRHRISSISQQSQRYVEEGVFEYITPEEISKDTTTNFIFNNAMREANEAYRELSSKLKEEYIKQGMNARDANKKAIEDARYVLPNACETKLVFTMNARSLLNFFSVRICKRAQWEIRELAIKMLDLVKEVSPEIFKYAGAGCQTGKCPEGPMTCGSPYPKIRV